MTGKVQSTVISPRATQQPGQPIKAPATHDLAWHWRVIKLDGQKSRPDRVGVIANLVKQRPDLAELVQVIEITNLASFSNQARAMMGGIVIHAPNLRALCIELTPDEPRILHALAVREHGQLRKSPTCVTTLILCGENISHAGNLISAECFRVIMNLPTVEDLWIHNLDVMALESFDVGLGTPKFEHAALMQNLQHLALDFDARNAAEDDPRPMLPTVVRSFNQLRSLRIHFLFNGEPYTWRRRLGNAIRHSGGRLEQLSLLLPNRGPPTIATDDKVAGARTLVNAPKLQEFFRDDIVGSLADLPHLKSLRIDLEELAHSSGMESVSSSLPGALHSLWLHRVKLERHTYGTTDTVLDVLKKKSFQYPRLTHLDCGVGSWTDEVIKWKSTSWQAIAEACNKASVRLTLRIAPWTVLQPINLDLTVVCDETESRVEPFLASVRREEWMLKSLSGNPLPFSGDAHAKPLGVNDIAQRFTQAQGHTSP